VNNSILNYIMGLTGIGLCAIYHAYSPMMPNQVRFSSLLLSSIVSFRLAVTSKAIVIRMVFPLGRVDAGLVPAGFAHHARQTKTYQDSGYINHYNRDSLETTVTKGSLNSRALEKVILWPFRAK